MAQLSHPQNPIYQTPHLPVTSFGLPKAQNSPLTLHWNVTSTSVMQEIMTNILICKSSSEEEQTKTFPDSAGLFGSRVEHMQVDRSTHCFQVSRRGANCRRSQSVCGGQIMDLFPNRIAVISSKQIN